MRWKSLLIAMLMSLAISCPFHSGMSNEMSSDDITNPELNSPTLAPVDIPDNMNSIQTDSQSENKGYSVKHEIQSVQLFTDYERQQKRVNQIITDVLLGILVIIMISIIIWIHEIKSQKIFNNRFRSLSRKIMPQNRISIYEEYTSIAKSPKRGLIFSLFLGVFGVDRFYIGHKYLGIFKLATAGGLGIMLILDWFLITDAVRKYNLKLYQQIIDKTS
jgi:TM2 domain-containing membrane protein YozV